MVRYNVHFIKIAITKLRIPKKVKNLNIEMQDKLAMRKYKINRKAYRGLLAPDNLSINPRRLKKTCGNSRKYLDKVG
jgi:hypothetical protein